MSLRRFAWLSLLWVLAVGLYAQSKEATWEEFAEMIAQRYAEAEADEEESLTTDYEELLERLHEQAQTKINLNTATREQLLALSFISPAQADSMLAYRQRKRGYWTLGELMFVSGLSYYERRYLPLFLSVAPPDSVLNKQVPLKTLLFGGKYEVETRLDVPLYRRAGYKSYTEDELTANPNLVYLGNGLTNVLRYRYRYGRQFRYGLTLDKDAGEPFAAKGNWPYDYAAFFAHYRQRRGRYEVLLGDYRVHLGQGLLLGSSFFGSVSQLLDRRLTQAAMLRPHTSTEENRFFRGAAGSVRLNAVRLTAFVSYRKLDARMENDSVRTLLTDGYHRTQRERERKDAVGCVAGGADVSYLQQDWQVGLSAFVAHYAKPLAPDERSYTQFYMRGQTTAGLSAHYRVGKRRWTLQGELAADKQFHLALSNTLTLCPDDEFSIVVQQRAFSKRFVAPFGQAVQAGSRVANEVGGFVGLKYTGFARTELRAYADFARFPAPVYRANSASNCLTLFAEGRYAFTQAFNVLLRYRYKTRQYNVTGYADVLEYNGTHRARLQANYAGDAYTLHAAFDFTAAQKQTAQTQFGWMLSARSTYKPLPTLSLAAFAGLFFTDAYAAAVYAYEPQLLYRFQVPAFYYHGWRTALQVQWKVVKHVQVGLRYSLLHYFNRDHISSGPQQIDGPTQQDLSLQMRLTF